ncbi:MAG: polysaccharide deacetylase family protein [Chloroflexota bacterium]
MMSLLLSVINLSPTQRIGDVVIASFLRPCRAVFVKRIIPRRRMLRLKISYIRRTPMEGRVMINRVLSIRYSQGVTVSFLLWVALIFVASNVQAEEKFAGKISLPAIGKQIRTVDNSPPQINEAEAFNPATSRLAVNVEAAQAAVSMQVSPPVSPLGITVTSAGYLRPEVTEAYIDYVISNEVKRGDEAGQALALTFDCGGSATAIQTVLSILKAGEAKGTFFLEGKTVEAHPEVVPLIMADDHDLGNHSYSHPRFTTLTQTAAISELVQTEALISAAADHPLPLRYFRFPYGDRNDEIKAWIGTLGYQSIFWDIDPRGWHATITTTDVISTVVNQAKPGGIVLMHCSAQADLLALPTIISTLKAEGYSFEPLSAILPPDPVELALEASKNESS